MAKWTLGLDPSSSRYSEGNSIGWCLFWNSELVETGELIPDPLLGFTRLRLFLRNKFKVINAQDPNPEITVACESAFLGPNAAIFQGLTRMKAHAEAATLDAGYLYKEVSPLESFQISTGLSQYPKNDKGNRRKTRKPAIQAAIKARYNLPEDIGEHICDSVAVAEVIVKRES